MVKKDKVLKAKNSQGLLFRTQIGQHILKNPLIVENIVERASLKTSDVVLEIGPGTGNLTAKLLERAKKVYVVEIDTRMIAELEKRFRTSSFYSKLKIIHGDALKVELPKFDVCVANLPYQISSPFIFRILSLQPNFRYAILMVQKEFANRLVAKPSDKCYCRLSINCQMMAKVENVLKVGKNNFKPPPKVDSCVVKIQPRTTKLNVKYEEWDGLTRICFVRKNKTLNAAFSSKVVLDLLLNNYRKYMESISKNVDADFDIRPLIKDVLVTSGFEEKRPRSMSIQEFMMLLKCFNEVGIHFASDQIDGLPMDED